MANLATISNNILADSGIDPIDLIVGTGTVNYIPKFTGEDTLANSSLRTDSLGNIGLGGAPSNAYVDSKSFEIGASGILWSEVAASVYNSMSIGNNFYYNAAGDAKYKNTGINAVRYSQYYGQHIWSTAPSGTAGATITFVNSMTLKATSQLQLNQYGSGTFTGTVAYNLAVDSSGNIIEVVDGGGTVTGSGVTNRITYWDSASSISYLDTASYPSLTELSYVKGVTSSIQTQIDSKAANNGSFGDANAPTIGGFFSGYNPTNIPSGQTSGDWGLLNAPMWPSNNSGERYTFQFAANLDSGANIFVRKFRYFGSVLESAWFTLLHSGNYNSYALPLTGGTLSGQLSLSYTNSRLSIIDGTNRLDLGNWDAATVRIEGGGRPMYMVSYGGTISIGRNGGTNLVVDTSSVTYGNVNFTSAGNFNGVGINISGVSALSGVVKHTGYPYKVYENLCAVDNYYGNAGAFAITTNIPWDAGNMLTIEVKGYDYNGGRNFTATFSCYAGENNFYSTGYTTNADDLFGKTYAFYRNASDKVVLVLGSTAGNYQYQLWVSEFKQGYNSLTSSYADGWTISNITSTTGLSNGTGITNKTYTGNIFDGVSVSASGAVTASSATFTGTGSGTSNTIVKVINTTTANALIDFANTANGFAFGFASTGTGGQRFVFINGAPTEIAYITGSGAAVFSSSVTGSSIIKTGGTSSQYLMADGSVSTLTNPVTGTGVTNRITYWDSASSISYLDTASYPSLTELSYVKGVTSSIQTQLNGKLSLSGGTLTGPLSGTSATFTGTFRVNQIGTATTPADSAGWRKIGIINSRGGGRLVISVTGGSWNPVTYVVDYYKNWASEGTLKLEKYGDPSYVTQVRIRQDSADNLYYIEINCASDPNGLELLVYDIQILGYNATSTIYTGSLAAGSVTGTTITTSTFIGKGTTVQQFRNEGTTTLADALTGTAATFSGTVESYDVNSFLLNQTGNTTDTKIWSIQNLPTSGDFRIRALNDGKTNGINAVVISRTGISSVSIALGGALSGTSASFSSSVTASSLVKTGGTSSQYLMADGSVSTLTNPVTGTGVTNRLTYWSGTSTIGYLDTASYPSLTEISYVKGVTSGIQNQLNNRVLKNDTNLTDANAADVTISGGFYTGFNPTNVPSGLSSLDIGVFNFPMWTGNNTNERYSVQMLANLDSNANIYIRKFRYFGSVTLSTWYTLLNSGNYSSYALPLSGGTVTGDTTFSGSGRRVTISDGTNSLTLGLWDGANVRLEGAGRPMYMVSYGGAISIGRSSGTNLVVDTSSVTYGSASFTSAGQFTGANLDISNNSLLNKVKYTQSNYRVYRNLARFDNYNNGTGALAITTNIPWDASNMLTIQVKGYTYGGNGPFDITFCCYAGEGNFYSPGYFTNSENTFAGVYYWARNASNKVVLILGNVGGTYGCQIWVSEYKQGFASLDTTYADGWSIAKITSTTGLSTITSIPVKTNTYGEVNASSLVVTNTGIDVFNSQMRVVNSSSGSAKITFSNTANGFAFGFASSGGQRFIWQNGAPTEIASLNASGQFTASAYFESSDARLKNIYRTHDSLEFGAIEYSWISDESNKLRWGYLAQDVQKWLPDAISENGNGYLTVDYTQAHTYKIAMLEKRVAELEQQLKNK
jgi:hypothetical protein